MGTAVPPAAPPRSDTNTASWSGTAYLSRQARLISQLTLISGGLSPVRHLGTRRDGAAEMEAVWPRKFRVLFCHFSSAFFTSSSFSSSAREGADSRNGLARCWCTVTR